MNTLKITKFIITILILAFSIQMKASHLVGGSMNYQYIGVQSNGKIRYYVKLKLYRDCNSKGGQGNTSVLFDEDITLGIYNNNSTLSLYKSHIFYFKKEVSADPPGKTNCPEELKDVCIKSTVYEDYIDVDPSSVGYYMKFERCCRNTQTNIVDDMGQTYFAFIPPTSIINSSPYFEDIPSAYICKSDTTNYFNNAVDPDGDSLVYKLVWPWHGGDVIGNNSKPNPDAFLSEPSNNLVIYRSGFGASKPFGNSGYIDLELSNGLTTYYSQLIGRFAIAIDVEEYRNGKLLSTVRLDVQLIVKNCLPNKAPGITYDAGGAPSNYKTVTAGDTICFNITGYDPEPNKQQEVTIKGKGNIFGGAGWSGPIATFPTKTAINKVTSQFCWSPSCAQVRKAPYSFVAEVTDNGCPPKSENQDFYITVLPFQGSLKMNGPTSVCLFEISTYSIAGHNGSRYKWKVTGGEIVGIDTLKSVDIKWTTLGGGIITVVETSVTGCDAPALNMNVIVNPSPIPNQILGQDSVCEFSTNKIYTVKNTPIHTYKWLVIGGKINGPSNSAQISINWLGKGDGKVLLIEFNQYGCPGDTNILDVAVLRPEPDDIFGNKSICPNAKAVEYWVVPNSGSIYNWAVENGTITNGNGTDTIRVNWGGTGFGKVKVVEISKFGCFSDTFSIDIKKGYALAGQVPIGPDSVCEYTKSVRYEVTKTNGSIFTWSIVGGVFTYNKSSEYVLVDWGDEGFGSVTVTETAYDSVNNKPCIGQPQTLIVVLNKVSDANIIDGTNELCQFTGEYQYSINGLPGSTYLWSINNDTINIKGQGTNTITKDWTKHDTFKIRVIETTKFNCSSLPVDTTVLVNPKPITSVIFGDSIVCNPNQNFIPYHVKGFEGSTFSWIPNSGVIESGNGNDSVMISWTQDFYNTLSVLEVSNKGCKGDTIFYDVFLDHPEIKLKVVSVGNPDDTQMDIKWELLNAPRYNSDIKIQRNNPEGSTEPWLTIATLDYTETTYTETKINTDIHPWQYRINGKDLCKNNIYSNIHQNIWLQVNQTETEALPFWSRYEGWNKGVNNYEVYRKINYEPNILLVRNVLEDTFDYFNDGLSSFVQTYRIKGYELNGGKEETWSNEISLNFEPIIWVPNAFTPNTDQINQNFTVISASLKTYNITIYNRWGQQIFYSDDYSKHWDGTYKGVPSPEGVYIYMIRYTGYNNRAHNLKGNITLLR